MKVGCVVKTTNTSGDHMNIFKDVERQPVNRPVTLLPSSRPEIQGGGDLHHDDYHYLQHHHFLFSEKLSSGYAKYYYFDQYRHTLK